MNFCHKTYPHVSHTCIIASRYRLFFPKRKKKKKKRKEKVDACVKTGKMWVEIWEWLVSRTVTHQAMFRYMCLQGEIWVSLFLSSAFQPENVGPLLYIYQNLGPILILIETSTWTTRLSASVLGKGLFLWIYLLYSIPLYYLSILL